ncbi:MAG TPA: DUF4126 domain-containing protein [Candidatus Dormibacteraeota bacterium]
MNPAVMQLPAAFGLAGATGLNATLPLFIVSLLARLGLIHLAPPYDALASDVAFWGLLVLAVVEFAIDKVPALDSVGHAVMLPIAAAAGGILFASQTGTVTSMDPGLSVVVSLLAGGAIATTVHLTRATVRPVANLAFLGPPISLIEDLSSAGLTLAAALVPIVVPFLLVLLVLAAMVLWDRRRSARPPAASRR